MLGCAPAATPSPCGSPPAGSDPLQRRRSLPAPDRAPAGRAKLGRKWNLVRERDTQRERGASRLDAASAHTVRALSHRAPAPAAAAVPRCDPRVRHGGHQANPPPTYPYMHQCDIHSRRPAHLHQDRPRRRHKAALAFWRELAVRHSLARLHQGVYQRHHDAVGTLAAEGRQGGTLRSSAVRCSAMCCGAVRHIDQLNLERAYPGGRTWEYGTAGRQLQCFTGAVQWIPANPRSTGHRGGEGGEMAKARVYLYRAVHGGRMPWCWQ
jgi:hypothetical protein